MLEISLANDSMVKDMLWMIENRKALYRVFPEYQRPFSAYANKECIRKIFEYVYEDTFYVIKKNDRILGFFCLREGVRDEKTQHPSEYNTKNAVISFMIGEYRAFCYRNVVRCMFDFCLRWASENGMEAVVWESFPYLSWFYSYTQEIGFQLCGHDAFLCGEDFNNKAEVLDRCKLETGKYISAKRNQRILKKYKVC